MGAFASLRVGAQRRAAHAQSFGAILFVVLVLFPVQSEAHVGLQQTGFIEQQGEYEFRKDCTARSPQSRAWIRGAGTCTAEFSLRVLPHRMLISGKVGEVLAAMLYCRSGSALTQFSRRAPACLPLPAPPQRLLSAASNEFTEWPADKLAPAKDQGRIEAFAFRHLPDG
jgi:hypothetical protein